MTIEDKDIHATWLGRRRMKTLNGFEVPATSEDLLGLHWNHLVRLEYRVRPLTRYFITRFTKTFNDKTSNTECPGEYASVIDANQAVRSMAQDTPGALYTTLFTDTFRIGGRALEGGHIGTTEGESGLKLYSEELRKRYPGYQCFTVTPGLLDGTFEVKVVSATVKTVPVMQEGNQFAAPISEDDLLLKLPYDMAAAMRRGARASDNRALLEMLDRLGIAVDA